MATRARAWPAVAGAAGVAVRTVYAAFGTKQAILAAICDAWLAEAEVASLIEQALAEPDAVRRLAVIARLNRQQWERGAEVVALLEVAAATDVNVARMLEGWKTERGRALSRSLPASRIGLPAGWTCRRPVRLSGG